MKQKATAPRANETRSQNAKAEKQQFLEKERRKRAKRDEKFESLHEADERERT
jgi:hypothetical protein